MRKRICETCEDGYIYYLTKSYGVFCSYECKRASRIVEGEYEIGNMQFTLEDMLCLDGSIQLIPKRGYVNGYWKYVII